jgi:hypothetical protein
VLFTEKFLRERVKPDANIARELIQTFTQVYVLWVNAQKNGADWTERETEKQLVQPILELLGWSFAVQVKIRQVGDVTHPDYSLFMDAMSRGLGKLYGEGNPEYFNQALAVAEAKHWNRPLDMRGSTERDSWKANANPDHQMIGYLKTSGVSWGVLTNGSIWRIYYHSSSSTATDLCEIDLSAIYSGVDPKHSPGADRLERFYIWWQIFHRNAFIRDGTGFAFVDRLRNDFIIYQTGVIERLLDRIKDPAVPVIVGAILLHRYRKYGQRPEAKINIETLTTTVVNLIYRLLFLFVAEHNGLMPADKRGHQVTGLCTLSNLSLSKQDEYKQIYPALLKLFETIYLGNKEQHVPAYHGDLFNPSSSEFKFLSEHVIPDVLMRKILSALTIDGTTGVDYECIDSNTMAYIAEKLLGVTISFVEMPSGRRELKVKLRGIEGQVSSDDINSQLSNPPIDYLTHQALKNVIKERKQKFNAAMEDIVAIKGAQHYKFQELKAANNRAMEAMLGLRVLDPSMHTGACIINVIQYLTKEIIWCMQVYHDLHPDIPWDWNPVYAYLDQERKRSLARLSRYGLEVEAEQLGDTRLLKRIITHKCVFGVEADPASLNIAKHNIWLATFSIGTPFGFLDHHLRQGNAMMGTLIRDDFGQRKQDVQGYLSDGIDKALKKLPETKSQLVTGRWNAGQYKVFHNAIQPYQHLLDLSSLAFLGHPAALELINRYNSDINAMYLDPKTKNLIAGVDFFHWDMEFPEVFVDKFSSKVNEQAGFHAVIGILSERNIASAVRYAEQFIMTHFPSIMSLHNKNWLIFAQGLRLLTETGYLAMVINRRVYVTRAGPLAQVLDRLLGDADQVR